MPIQKINNNPSFGMALKVTPKAMKALIKSGSQDDFIKAKPFLDDMGKTINLTIDHEGHHYDFMATPLNRFNNKLTRWFYDNANKMGKYIHNNNKLNYPEFIIGSDIAIDNFKILEEMTKKIKSRM